MILRKTSFRPPDAWRRPDILTASFFINLLGMMLPIMILQVYDRIIPNAAFGTLLAIVAVLCVGLIAEIVLRIIRTKLLSALGARYQHRTALQAFQSLLKSDYTAYSEESATVYTDRISSIQSIRDFYTGQAATLAIDLPFVVIFLSLITLIGGALVLVPLVLLGVLLCIVYYMGNRLTDALQSHAQTDKRRHNFLIETLQGVHTVKSLGMERMMVRRHERLLKQSANEVVNLGQLHAMSMNLATTFSQFAMVTYVAIGSFSVIAQEMTLGGLAAGTMLTGRVLQPVLRGLNFWIRYQSIQIAEHDLEEVFNLTPENAGACETMPNIKGEITFKNVSFRYHDDQPWIFQNLSLHIPAGSTIGITGGNGCGLSTFFALINGLIRPVEGQVLIDGQNIHDMDLESVRQQIGYMPEFGHIFHGTILENITSFREGETKKRAIDVLRLLGLDDIIVRLPKGLETVLGGSIVNALPSGLQQQFIIARVLVDNPPIILFDNAHSGLDFESDDRLKKALMGIRTNKTMVLGTCRPSFLNFCDVVYDLKDGKMCERQNMSSPQPPQRPALSKLQELSDDMAKRSGRDLEESDEAAAQKSEVKNEKRAAS